MTALLKSEWKAGIKTLAIWAFSVGGMGLICLLLYQSMEESMAGMAESFASMGAFSDAFGMSTLSIATLKGYFATEIGTIHALGSSFFAACVATVILSKEEDAHTAEFTFTLPLARWKIVVVKFLTVFISLICFMFICGLFYGAAFFILGESGIGKEFIFFMLLQLMMNVEVAAICFVISALSKKNRLGVGIAVAMVLYMYDIMARVVPDLKDVLFLSPFSYANATAVFSNADMDTGGLVLGTIVIVVMTGLAGFIYARRDLAS